MSAAAETQRSQAIIDVIRERVRQIEGEGWTPEHDDQHDTAEMAAAAAAYALAASGFRSEAIMELWPRKWSRIWFKPTSSRRDLVKAAALLLIAEIERLDRAAAGRDGSHG